ERQAAGWSGSRETSGGQPHRMSHDFRSNPPHRALDDCMYNGGHKPAAPATGRVSAVSRVRKLHESRETCAMARRRCAMTKRTLCLAGAALLVLVGPAMAEQPAKTKKFRFNLLHSRDHPLCTPEARTPEHLT